MKVVFLQPRSFHTWESLNIGYMAAYLKQEIPGITVEFYTDFFDTEAEIISGCRDADIIGISATSPQYARGCELALMVKRPGNWIVMGGYHVTNVKYKPSFIDQIVVGEGEGAMLRICKGDRFPVVHSEPVPMDKIPYPDRGVMKQMRNIDACEKTFGTRYISLLANRGCPYRCVFCSSKSMFPKQRCRTPENIFSEFMEIARVYNAGFVKFSDDEFGTNRKQMRDFCELLVHYENRTHWGCNIVAGTLDKNMLSLMRMAGCAEVWMGVESGDDALLRSMHKPCTVGKIRQTFSDAREVGLKRRAYCILGMPDESIETVARTESLIDEIEPDVVGFTVMAPYPGNQFYKPEYRDIDWTNIDEYANGITRTKYLTNEELRSIQKRLTAKYAARLTDRQRCL